MNNLRSGLITIFLTILSLPTISFAGNEGHGGDGVLINNKPYVLDLVESGVELAPYFDSAIIPDTHISDELNSALSSLGANAATLIVAKKLTELKRMDVIFAYRLSRRALDFNWLLVNGELENIQDEDTVLEYNNLKLIQLAIRRNGTIRIANSSWQSLDDANKAALILHEIIYSMTYYEMDSSNGEEKYDSPAARTIIGYLFTPLFLTKGRSGLVKTMQNSTTNKKPWLHWISEHGLIKVENGQMLYDPTLKIQTIYKDVYGHEDSGPVTIIHMVDKTSDFKLIESACANSKLDFEYIAGHSNLDLNSSWDSGYPKEIYFSKAADCVNYFQQLYLNAPEINGFVTSDIF